MIEKLESIKRVPDSFVNPLIKKASNKYWEKTTDYFKDEVMLRRFLVNSFDSSVKISSLKKGSPPDMKKPGLYQ